MTQPVLAAQLYTIRDHTKTTEDFAASMKKIRDIGYTSVQVSVIGPIPHEDVKRILDDNGLTVCITHIGYDRLTDDLLLGIGEHIGDVETSSDLDVHARRHVGLGVEVDDECPHTPGERRGGETQSHGRLADTPLE